MMILFFGQLGKGKHFSLRTFMKQHVPSLCRCVCVLCFVHRLGHNYRRGKRLITRRGGLDIMQRLRLRRRENTTT